MIKKLSIFLVMVMCIASFNLVSAQPRDATMLFNYKDNSKVLKRTMGKGSGSVPVGTVITWAVAGNPEGWSDGKYSRSLPYPCKTLKLLNLKCKKTLDLRKVFFFRPAKSGEVL